MKTFKLTISSPEGDVFSDDITKISLRGTEGDFAIMAGHVPFVTTIKPTYSVICDSEKNPAEEETISILEFAGSEIFSTKDGDVSVISDGNKIEITQ